MTRSALFSRAGLASQATLGYRVAKSPSLFIMCTEKMAKNVGNGLQDRLKAQQDAKAKLLERFKKAPKADDPEMIARREERAKIAAAREERRLSALEKKKQEQEALEALKREEEERLVAEKRAEADRLVQEEIDRKAERDRRYAARKARKGKRG